MTLEDRNQATRDALDKVNSRKLLAELQYYLEIDDDENRSRDLYAALRAIEDRASPNQEPSLLAAARRALIILGVYREVTPEELAGSVTLRGGKQRPSRPDFRLNRKAYRFEKHLAIETSQEGNEQ